MAELIYSISILTQGIDGIAKLLMNDLSKFGVHIKSVANLKEFYDHANSAPPERQSFLICAADVAYSTVIAELKKKPIRNLRGVLLYCGPHEEFYARWALQHRQILFLTHNLKELRRAVLWIMSGGTFAPNGDAVPPPVTVLKGPSVVSSCRSYPSSQRSLENKNNITIPANIVDCNSTPPGFSELLSDMELPEMLIQSILSKQMGGGMMLDTASNSNRCSTETTASNATSDATEDKLNDIAQLVALFEALRIPSSP